MEEKRRHRRVEYQTEVTCIPNDGEPFMARSKDVSLGGMFVESDQKPAFGTQLIVEMSFPGHSKPLALPCVVRWNMPEGFGIQFGLLGAKETHALTRIMR